MSSRHDDIMVIRYRHVDVEFVNCQFNLIQFKALLRNVAAYFSLQNGITRYYKME